MRGATVSLISRLYAWTRPEVALQQYRVFSALSQGLLDYGFDDLTPVEFLDVGCGAGSLLRTLAEWGAEPSRLHGIDLLQDRIERAQALCPAIDYRQHSGWELPYADESMDIVTAMTVFSSILSPEARQALATEMERVARPGGMIVIFDFRVSSPRNPDTTGIGRGEVQRLFPDFTVKSRSLILAPPLQRPLAKLSPWLALTLETFIPFLRTHTFHFLRNSK
ncbi:class I SAM-dependent methyltransferase [Thiohalophilus sp.]|uniref:class I SAM-dependent methyltransferase n=1 Tax=Thiohalophilus sp. TaxID=3028392 RepID=UPI002ACE1DF2|nr:class I SAM-dependent methyltransferase [Thiohalophilus sp.]